MQSEIYDLESEVSCSEEFDGSGSSTEADPLAYNVVRDDK